MHPSRKKRAKTGKWTDCDCRFLPWFLSGEEEREPTNSNVYRDSFLSIPVWSTPRPGRTEGAGLSSLGCGAMARLYPSLLLLVATMVLVCRDIRTWGWKKVVREFKDIPESYVYVQQALWFAMKEYNKASKDKYTFKVVKVLKSQEQVGGHLLLSSLHVCGCGGAVVYEWKAAQR